MKPDPDDGSEHLTDDTVVQVFRAAEPGGGRSRNFQVVAAAALLVVRIANASDDRSEAVEAFWLERAPSRMALTGDESVWLRATLGWLRGCL